MPRSRPLVVSYLALIAFTFVSPLAAAEALVRPPAQTTQPSGPIIRVPDEVNLRSGPGVTYDLVGRLIQGQVARALGRSPGGDWIQVEYIVVPEKVAWAYSPLVNLSVPISDLPIVEPPPTPTLAPLPTLDPAIVLSLEPTFGPTRLPTFTPAPPVAQATLLPSNGIAQTGGLPPAVVIAAFFVIGVFGVVVSLLRATR